MDLNTFDKVTPETKHNFDTNIGQGGISIKNHLKDNLDQDAEENDDKKIKIDINPLS